MLARGRHSTRNVRNVMLPPHVCKKLGSRPSVAGFHIIMSLANPFNRLAEILPFPFQIGCKSTIQGCGRDPGRATWRIPPVAPYVPV